MESVWDYPRPPSLVPCAMRVRVEVGGMTIADSTDALRVLETSQAPGIYIPPGDVAMEYLTRTRRRTMCEWKGQAAYFDVTVGDRAVRDAAWAYADPVAAYAGLRDHVAYYPQRVDACFVGDERVDPNQGDFYGGWITSDLRGPFKGGPGSRGW